MLAKTVAYNSQKYADTLASGLSIIARIILLLHVQ